VSPDIQVLVVDDQEPFRLVAAAVIDATDGFTHACSAASGEEAVAVFENARGGGLPQLVLMDVNLPGIDGFEATRRIRAIAPSVRVVILSTYLKRDYGSKATDAGAEAHLDKADFSPMALEALWLDGSAKPNYENS
jgi:CheY-like chemotaxis protein